MHVDGSLDLESSVDEPCEMHEIAQLLRRDQWSRRSYTCKPSIDARRKYYDKLEDVSVGGLGTWR